MAKEDRAKMRQSVAVRMIARLSFRLKGRLEALGQQGDDHEEDSE